MESNPAKKYFARLEIGLQSPKERRRVISFTRVQFEILMVMIPAAMIWGVISTGYIFLRMYGFAERGEATQAPRAITAPPPAQPSAVSDQISREARAELPAAGTPAPWAASKRATAKVVNYAGAKFKMDDIFAVVTKVTGPTSQGPFTVFVTLDNLTGELEKGRLWVRVKALSTDGSQLFLSSGPRLEFLSDGRVANPDDAVRFSVRYSLTKSLALYGERQMIRELQTIEVGFDRGAKGQSVATVSLNKDGQTL